MGFFDRVFVFVFSLGVVFLWLALILFTLRYMVRWHIERMLPVESLSASVTRKFEQEEWVYIFARKMVASYHAEFAAADGRTFTFSLLPRQYESLREGDSGILNIRNGAYVSFQSRTQTGQDVLVKGTDAEQVYSRVVKM